jgi:hypothetical protein
VGFVCRFIGGADGSDLFGFLQFGFELLFDVFEFDFALSEGNVGPINHNNIIQSIAVNHFAYSMLHGVI